MTGVREAGLLVLRRSVIREIVRGFQVDRLVIIKDCPYSGGFYDLIALVSLLIHVL
jgi:hypothetical protein